MQATRPQLCIVLEIYAIPLYFLFGKGISFFHFSFLAAYFSAPIVHWNLQSISEFIATEVQQEHELKSSKRKFKLHI